MIVSVGVIGKANNPLAVKVFSEADALKFHYIIHASLDVFEERDAARGSPHGPGVTDLYLSMLFPIEEYKLYGYVTSTNIKFVIVFDEADAKDENLIKNFFRRLHSLYADCVANPFYKIGDKIESKQFHKELEGFVKMWNSDSFR